MKYRTQKKVLFVLVIISLLATLSSCYGSRMKEYYAKRENYINATGIVTHISYNEDNTALYFAFTELTPQFDDNSFKIVGDSLSIVQESGIDQTIKIGDQVDFVTAPRYFGDGYVMPIVAISVNGAEILGFEEGFDNLLKWLR